MNNTSYLKIALIGVILIGIYYWVSNPLTVTVTGTGEATIPASEAIISLSATEINNSPITAVNELTAKVALLKNTLADNGVERSKIIESQVNVVPASTVVPGATGYAAVITLGGPTANVANAGNLTGLLYERGASLVSQPVLSSENQQELEEEALSLALKDAKEKAGKIGTKHLKFIRFASDIVQGDTPTSSNIASQAEANSDSEDASGFDPNTPPNSFRISKVVQVTYNMW